MSKVLDNLKKDMESHVAAYSKALVKNDFQQMSSIENELKDAEGAYAEEQMRACFAECRAADNPILEAVRRYSYTVMAHRVLREDGNVVGIELTEREKQISLVKLAKFCDMSHLWEYKVEKFGSLLCMRAAKELGMTDAEVKKIEGLYYMNELSKVEELGGVPTSNNQIVKLLQSVIDAVLYVEGDNGKNMYRCNNHDVAYLLMCYTKRNKKKTLTIDVAKNTFVHSLVMDVMHRLVTGKSYDLNYQIIKTEVKKDAKPAPKAPAPKVSEAETIRIPRPKAEVPADVPDELPTMDEIPAEALSA